jgi:oligopeptidase B
VLDHLRKENAFAAQQTAHLEETRATLYAEHVGHLKETDDKAPYKYGEFFYYARTVQGLAYPVHCRKPAQGTDRLPRKDAKEEVVLDENKVAEGRVQCVVGGMAISPDHTKLAYTVDYTGAELYQIIVIELATGKVIDDGTTKSDSGVTWGDDKTLFYTVKDDISRCVA